MGRGKYEGVRTSFEGRGRKAGLGLVGRRAPVLFWKSRGMNQGLSCCLPSSGRLGWKEKPVFRQGDGQGGRKRNGKEGSGIS